MGRKAHNKTAKLEGLLGHELSYELFYSTPRTQAERIIFKFNGARELHRILKELGIRIAPSTIYKWSYGWDKGGTGGVIPNKNWEHIERAAKYAGIFLELEDYDPRKIKFKDKKYSTKAYKDRKYGRG